MSKIKTALVTGGSRGISAAVVARFASEGWNVIFTYVSNTAAAEEVAKTTGARAVKCDAGSEAEILSFMKTLDDEGISIDALVNNAGITGPKRRMEEVTAETLEEVMRVNITGVVLMCREAVKRMSTTHGGRGGVIVTYRRRQQLREAPINGLIIQPARGPLISLPGVCPVKLAQKVFA